MEFNKLEKVEYGGSKGQTFSEKTEQMFSSFVELTQRIQQKSCDPLDTADDVSDILYIRTYIMGLLLGV